MLGLKLPTDPRWANIAEDHLEEILTDHAFCEQKAASHAISIIVSYSELSGLVQVLTDIALEELQHFKMVHDIIMKRNMNLGRKRKDDYVNELYKFVRQGGSRTTVLIDKLLFAAMIEARSCERFKLLSEKIEDKELAAFYNELMISEAGHYTTYIGLARKHSEGEDVDKRWKEFLIYEAEVISRYGKKETIHG